MNSQHLHEYKIDGDYYKCSCGKQILKFNDKEGVLKGVRSNGRIYTKKANVNRFLFPDEYLKIDYELGERSRHTAKFLLNTGVRISEGRKMPIIDFFYNPQGRSRMTVRFVKTKARKGEFKTGKQREIPLSSSFANYLNKWIKKKNKEFFNLLSTPAFNVAVKKAAKKVGIRNPHDISAHTFRKTLEVWLLALDTNSMKILAHLGHDMDTAMSNYVSPDIFSIEDKMKIRHILGDLYK